MSADPSVTAPDWLSTAFCESCGADVPRESDLTLDGGKLKCASCLTGSGEWLDAPPGYHAGTVVRKMRPEGRGTSGVLAIGEALGANEEKDGLPFRPYAEAGSVLERALWRAGVPRESLLLSNLVWYRPPNNWLDGAPWEHDAIATCERWNQELVDRYRPRVVLALGAVAFRHLTGMVGPKQNIEMTRGFVVPGLQYAGIPVIGTYHPSHLRRGSKERQATDVGIKDKSAGGGTLGMALLGVLIRDLQLAVEVARTGAPKFAYDDYKLGATLDDWTNEYLFLRNHPDVPISYDFETTETFEHDSEEDQDVSTTEITQAQISWRPGQAIVSPWTQGLLPSLRDILSLPNPKLDWNGRRFDRPIGRHYGITFAGELHDCMDLWHHAQPDLPRGLQYATSFFCPEVGPWKHISGHDPLYYGALDVDMPQRIYAALRRSLRMVREPHSGWSLWDGYHAQTVRLAPALDDMSVRGVPVDDVQRQALGTEFDATLDRIGAAMQAHVPDVLRNVHPKNGYKRTPKEVAHLEGQGLVMAVDNLPTVEDLRAEGWCRRTFTDEKTGTPVERWCKLESFNVGSSDQVLRYLVHARKQDIERLTRQRSEKRPQDSPVACRLWAEDHTEYYIPMHPKTRQPTMAAGELERVAQATGDPVLLGRLEYSETQTARGTFVNGWKPAADGCVHAFFGFKPAGTGQISSDSPNVQNWPKHTSLARIMGRLIAAKPGHRIVAFDYKGFHVLTLGFEAQDPLYVRMARIDMHSFFLLGGMLRLEPLDKLVALSDDELRTMLAWYRKSDRTYREYGDHTFDWIRNAVAKHAILGYGNGQGANTLHRRYREGFPTVGDAQRCQDTLDGVFDKPKAWKRAVAMEADEQSYLVTRYGFVRRFWDVLSRRPLGPHQQPRKGQEIVVNRATGQRWAIGHGDDYEAAVSYRIQNDAFGIKRERMVELHENGLAARYGLMLEIHDALIFHCPDGLVDECVATVRAVMQRPSKVLVDPVVAPDGLWAEVEASVGRNWDYADAENPEGMRKG